MSLAVSLLAHGCPHIAISSNTTNRKAELMWAFKDWPPKQLAVIAGIGVVALVAIHHHVKTPAHIHSSKYGYTNV
jgi:hypothetical protein